MFSATCSAARALAARISSSLVKMLTAVCVVPSLGFIVA